MTTSALRDCPEGLKGLGGFVADEFQLLASFLSSLSDHVDRGHRPKENMGFTEITLEGVERHIPDFSTSWLPSTSVFVLRRT